MTELQERVRELGSRAQNISDVNAQLSSILKLAVDDKFEEEGPGWPDLSPHTLARRRKSKSPKMLVDTGQLIGSLAENSGVDFVEVFTNVPYAKFHVSRAHGGTGGTKYMKPRDFFDVDEGVVLERMARALVEEIARQR